MEKVAKEALSILMIAILVYGFVVAKSWWITLLCVVIRLGAAILWISWDWIIQVLRHGRTFRG